MYFASTPSIERLKRRLCAKQTSPLTCVHFGLSAGRWEFETEILNSPQAAAFRFTNVKRSVNAALKIGIMKVVSPSGKAQLIVSSSIIKAGAPGLLVPGFATGDTRL